MIQGKTRSSGPFSPDASEENNNSVGPFTTKKGPFTSQVAFENNNKTKQQGNSCPDAVGSFSTKKGPFSSQVASDEQPKSNSNRTQNRSIDIVPYLFFGTTKGNLKSSNKPNEIISSIFDNPTESNDEIQGTTGLELHIPSVARRQLFSPSIPSAATSNIPITIPMTPFPNGQMKKKVFQFHLFDLLRSYETLFIVLLLVLSPALLHISDIITSVVQVQYIHLTAWLSSVWPRIIELSVPVGAFITNNREQANKFLGQVILNASFVIDSTKAQLLVAAEKAIICIAVGVVISLVLDWDMKRFDKVLCTSWHALPSIWSISSILFSCMTATRVGASAVVEVLNTIARIPSIIQSTLLYRLAFYLVGILSLAGTVRWVCRNVITMAASTAASYGPAGLRVVVSAAVTFLVVAVIWFFFTRRRRRIAAEQGVVNSVVLYVKRQLSEVHKGEPHPVEYFYEVIADAWRLPPSSYSFFSNTASVAAAATPLHLNSAATATATTPSEPFLRVAGVRWSLSLWKQVQREVEKDRRVQIVDVEVDGASRRWVNLSLAHVYSSHDSLVALPTHPPEGVGGCKQANLRRRAGYGLPATN